MRLAVRAGHERTYTRARPKVVVVSLSHEHPLVAHTKYNMALVHKKRRETAAAKKLMFKISYLIQHLQNETNILFFLAGRHNNLSGILAVYLTCCWQPQQKTVCYRILKCSHRDAETRFIAEGMLQNACHMRMNCSGK